MQHQQLQLLTQQQHITEQQASTGPLQQDRGQHVSLFKMFGSGLSAINPDAFSGGPDAAAPREYKKAAICDMEEQGGQTPFATFNSGTEASCGSCRQHPAAEPQPVHFSSRVAALAFTSCSLLLSRVDITHI
eukprot:GHRR01020085.1.p2 GENE.GHRR01020085.1~~GHRR01020085.1.p2  ORF type:complete len:132 (+),score=61.95 GHRR01020085.1:1817-2212(+)